MSYKQSIAIEENHSHNKIFCRAPLVEATRSSVPAAAADVTGGEWDAKPEPSEPWCKQQPHMKPEQSALWCKQQLHMKVWVWVCARIHACACIMYASRWEAGCPA
eukprot:1160237-Pelagomonas_calceolata.AAC.10